MDRTRLPDYTLRKHTSAITQLIVSDNDTCDEGDLVPRLVSSDETGNIIVWDLLTRRPVNEVTIPTGASIVGLELVSSMYLVSLSKDYTLRIFDWTHLNDKCLFEMSVNTLNFANFAISVKEEDPSILKLCCCNTQDSETIDIYQINVKTSKLTRLFNHVDFFQILNAPLHIELMKKPDKLGMIMKFQQDPTSGTIFLGFESGIIVGFQIEDERLRVTYLSACHFPEPVLDLQVVPQEYTNSCGILISSSTTNSIGKHWFPLKEPSGNTLHMGYFYKRAMFTASITELIEVKGSKIAHIAKINNYLIWCTWGGKLYIKDVNSDIVSKYTRSKGFIRPNESSQGSIASKSNSMEEPTYVKIGAMVVFKEKKAITNTMDGLLVLNTSMQRRLNQFITHSWCFIGYNDGTISLYEIK